MQRLFKTLLSAALITAGAGVGAAFANDHEVNNVWWSSIYDYNGSSQTACVAENYNEHAVQAVFDLYPAESDIYGNPMLPQRAFVVMQPYTTYQLFSWPDGAALPPHCALRSSTVVVP